MSENHNKNPKKLKSLKESRIVKESNFATNQSGTIASNSGSNANFIKYENSESSTVASVLNSASFKPKVNVIRKKKGFSEEVPVIAVKKEPRGSSDKSKRNGPGIRSQKLMHQSEGGLFSQGPSMPSASSRPRLKSSLSSSEIISAKNLDNDILIDTVPSDFSSSDEDLMEDFIVDDEESLALNSKTNAWKPISFSSKQKIKKEAVKPADEAVKVKEEVLGNLSSSNSNQAMIPDEISVSSSSSVVMMDQDISNIDIDINQNGLNRHLLGHQILIDHSERKQKLLFFQLPAVLPVSLENGQSQIDTKLPHLQMAYNQHKQTRLPEIPSGQIGSFSIMKSGKMVMEIGGIQFTVASKPSMTSGVSSPSQFICAIDPIPEPGQTSGKMAVLGECHEQLVATPDISSLLM